MYILIEKHSLEKEEHVVHSQAFEERDDELRVRVGQFVDGRVLEHQVAERVVLADKFQVHLRYAPGWRGYGEEQVSDVVFQGAFEGSRVGSTLDIDQDQTELLEERLSGEHKDGFLNEILP